MTQNSDQCDFSHQRASRRKTSSKDLLKCVSHQSWASKSVQRLKIEQIKGLSNRPWRIHLHMLLFTPSWNTFSRSLSFWVSSKAQVRSKTTSSVFFFSCENFFYQIAFQPSKPRFYISTLNEMSLTTHILYTEQDRDLCVKDRHNEFSAETITF